ncbi:MAG TPA: transcriptional regulator [Gammaproteobacteria bacterium]|jgi:hypothetical protein|nr:transcriptional regulator [Gammaproteobacteria bacterium]
MSKDTISIIEKCIFEYLIQIDDYALKDYLKIWPTRPLEFRNVVNIKYDALRYLGKVKTRPIEKYHELVKKLIDSKNDLFWRQSYDENAFGKEFLDRYAHTELIGTRGPIVSDKIACGFLLLGPDIEYPGHSHEAEELYLPFSKALWKKGSSEWVERPAGSLIYHDSWVSHSMKTTSEPLLALYIWKGGSLDQIPDIL